MNLGFPKLLLAMGNKLVVYNTSSPRIWLIDKHSPPGAFALVGRAYETALSLVEVL